MDSLLLGADISNWFGKIFLVIVRGRFIVIESEGDNGMLSFFQSLLDVKEVATRAASDKIMVIYY